MKVVEIFTDEKIFMRLIHENLNVELYLSILKKNIMRMKLDERLKMRDNTSYQKVKDLKFLIQIKYHKKGFYVVLI